MNQLVIKKKNELTKKKKGFTLVELIIVIAIIALLAAMAIPKFSSVRIDAKVSNDVAAAKNIQSQLAVGLANGDVTAPQSTAIAIPATILSKLDGKASDGKTEAVSGTFTYKIDDKENITIFAAGSQLYPDTDGSKRKAYLATARS